MRGTKVVSSAPAIRVGSRGVMNDAMNAPDDH
jgi:hypothetical protein